MKKSVRLLVRPELVRPHRFPPLLNLAPGQNLSEGQKEYQQGFQQGFAQGMNEGHEQGIQQGLAQGQQTGYEQGYTEGLTAGRRDGEQQGRAQFDAALQPLPALQARLESLAITRLAEQQQSLVSLVEQVARRVIQAELSLHPQQLLTLVDEALAALPGEPDAVHIYLNPDDCQRLSVLGYAACGDWPLEADPALAQGDCRVECADSIVESSIGTRLESCVDSVREVLLSPADSADGA